VEELGNGVSPAGHSPVVGWRGNQPVREGRGHPSLAGDFTSVMTADLPFTAVTRCFWASHEE